MTVTSVPTPKVKREITVAYLGDLLLNAGFIDQKQRADVENADLNLFVFGQRFERLDVGHFPIGIVQDELLHRRFVKLRQDRFVTFREDRLQ